MQKGEGEAHIHIQKKWPCQVVKWLFVSVYQSVSLMLRSRLKYGCKGHPNVRMFFSLTLHGSPSLSIVLFGTVLWERKQLLQLYELYKIINKRLLLSLLFQCCEHDKLNELHSILVAADGDDS